MTATVTSTATTATGRLTLPPNPFVGREREVRELRTLLARPDMPCLTLTGPGGVGKTRLALQVAASLAADHRQPFQDGIWFVPLAAVTAERDVPEVIALALGIELGPAPAEELVTDFLRERESLLILDNVEQVIDAAPFFAALVAACPDLKLIVTSRRPLRISGEQEYGLAPLPAPEPGATALERNPAVALFVQRARMVNPAIALDGAALEIVAEICRRLDGLPLAIELAAARVKALSPAALRTQLRNRFQVLTGGPRDAPARLQTLRDTIGWSFDLLEPRERDLFVRLAIFAGGFRLTDAERVDAAAGGDGDPLESVAMLVDHSLLQAADDGGDEPRWRMLETIREFGLERARDAGIEERLRELHADTMARLALDAETGLRGGSQAAWVRTLTAEHDNLRAALIWAGANGRPDLMLIIVGGTWRYWSIRHLGAEGREWLARALDLPGEVPPMALGIGRRGAGCLAEDIGDYASAEAHHREALRVWRALDDQPRIARALDDLGNVAHDQGDYATAVWLHTESLEVARAAGDRRGIASALANLGAVAFLQGDYLLARERWQQVRSSQVVADPLSLAMVLNNLSATYLQEGHLEPAERLLEEALAIYRTLGMPAGVADALVNVADVASRRGERERADRHFQEAIELYRLADDPKGLCGAFASVGHVAAAAGDHPAALRAYAAGLRYADRANNRQGVAELLEHVAAIAAARGSAPDAARLAAAAAAIWSALGSAGLPARREVAANLEAALAAALSPGDLRDARAEGGAWLPRQAAQRGRELAERLAATVTPVTPVHAVAPTAGAPSPAARLGLTKREIEVLRLLANGFTDRQIAAELYISHRTAGTHVNNLLGKLSVETRAAAVAAAFRSGVLTGD